jgi:hypothetical protein
LFLAQKPALIFKRLRLCVGVIQEKDRDLLVGLLADIHGPMNAGDRLFPFNLPRPNRKTLAFASIAVLDQEQITSHDHRHATKRIAMPGHGLTRSKTQAAHDCGAVLQYDFVGHFDSRNNFAIPAIKLGAA